MGRSSSSILFLFLLFTLFVSEDPAQDDVMMQGFHFNVPVDVRNRNGTWWDNLAARSQDLKDAGFKGIWTPPPNKGVNGIEDVGYSIFSHFDLGNYNLNGTVETRYGSRAELENMVAAMHARGIEVYVDVVLHQLVTDYRSLEVNPFVKSYVDGEANAGTHVAFPTNDIVWRLPSAEPGEYHFQIKGYNLPCSADVSERGYEMYATWTNPDPNNPFEPNYPQPFRPFFESEPNDGNGSYNVFPASGNRIWGYIDQCGDIDEYSLTLSRQADINIVLTSMRGSGRLAIGDQTHGFRIVRVVGPHGDVTSALKALTKTHIDHAANQGVSYNGPGEQNWVWDYTYFHPDTSVDYLETFDGTDGVIPRARFYGNDIDTSDPRAADRLVYWGRWLTDQIGYDGYRMDSVNLFENEFAASWINSMPRRADGSQRFVVGEYASVNKSRLKQWVSSLAAQGADAKVFDFNLKYDLNRLANGNSSTFNMADLNHSGLIRDASGQNIPASQVVTFAEIHDTARPTLWIEKDWQLPYAYLLFSEGRPCILYAHFFGATLAADGAQLTTPISLQQDIRRLIAIRRQQLAGDTIVLSEIGNPSPASLTSNLYVARRRGDLTANRPGAILALNNSEAQTQCLTVDNSPRGSQYQNWMGRTLVDLAGFEPETHVGRDGRVQICAPPRGYSVYVPTEWMNGRASDFDRDGLADPAVWRPSTGTWYVLRNYSSYDSLNWGISGDKPVPGDYDGDRITDIAVWRPSGGVWYVLLSSAGFDPARAMILPWGAAGDVTVQADYDGDGKTDVGIFRPQTGTWYIRNSSDGSFRIINWGLSGDLPVAADYDNDGRADIGVYRPSSGVWYILNSGVQGFTAYRFGLSEDKPVPADFDGDRRADVAVYRPSSGTWYILGSRENTLIAKNFGLPEDQPAPSDFDGDGKADIAVWRPSDGNWYILRSSDNSFSAVRFGQNGDLPVRSGSIPE